MTKFRGVWRCYCCSSLYGGGPPLYWQGKHPICEGCDEEEGERKREEKKIETQRDKPQ